MSFLAIVALGFVVLISMLGMEADGPVKMLAACTFAVSAFILYFAPGIVAAARNHRNENAIVILNFLLGWTGLGWIAAIVWAYAEDTTPRRRPVRSAKNPADLKKCCYCAESINFEAIRCRYCGSDLPDEAARIKEKAS